ncbi:MAG: Maf family protein [Cellvibrionaceae bacterium]
MSLYLASQSPRRRELLDQIGVRYRLLAPRVDESLHANEPAGEYVTRLAAAKAACGAALVAGDSPYPVLGADTTVVLGAEIMGKPADEADAVAMLNRLSGQTHRVVSAVSVAGGGRQITRLSITEVTFRPLDQALIARYWLTGEPRDKAGAYGIQGLGAAFVQKISGSYSGVVGLPLEVLVPLLDEFQVPYWQSVGRTPAVRT